MISKEEWRDREGISLGNNDSRVEFIQCDLGNVRAVEQAATQLKQKTGRLHILFCNAGMIVTTEAQYTRRGIVYPSANFPKAWGSHANIDSPSKVLNGFLLPIARATKSWLLFSYHF